MCIALEVIIAALAVFGLYYVIKVITGRFFSAKELSAAVIIENETQLENLDILISEASSALFCVCRRRIDVFVLQSIWDGYEKGKKAELISLCCDHGVRIYMIEHLY